MCAAVSVLRVQWVPSAWSRLRPLWHFGEWFWSHKKWPRGRVLLSHRRAIRLVRLVLPRLLFLQRTPLRRPSAPVAPQPRSSELGPRMPGSLDRSTHQHIACDTFWWTVEVLLPRASSSTWRCTDTSSTAHRTCDLLAGKSNRPDSPPMRSLPAKNEGERRGTKVLAGLCTFEVQFTL